MPPEIPADDDNSGLFVAERDDDSDNEIPARAPKSKDMQMADADEEDAEEEEGDEDEEAEYVVEAIVSHKGKGKNIQYHVKWQGYEDPSDMTWEPEANLDNAKDLVSTYWKALGGRPESQDDNKKRRISQAASTPTAAREGKSTKRARNSTTAPKAEAKPKTENATGSKERIMPKIKDIPDAWDKIIDHVETIEQVRNPKDGKLELMVRVMFGDGLDPWRGSVHIDRIRKGAPQKLLDYMEQHLSFRPNSPDAGAAAAAEEAEPNGTS